MADMVIRIQSFGVRQLERKYLLRSNERIINREMRQGLERLGEDSVYALQNHAPFRTGRLSDNITAIRVGKSARRPVVDIGVEAEDNGFSYVNVTRFGRKAVHAKNYRPDHRPEAGSGRSRLARSYDYDGPGAQKRPFRRMSLRFEPGPPGSGFMYRHSVRAYRPGRDWVAEAIPEIERLGDAEFENITSWIDYFMNDSPRPSGARRVSVRRTSRTGRLR